MSGWVTSSLSRKVVTAVAAVLAAASFAFLLLLVSLYWMQLQEEGSRASERINRLLQASLENAMVKRDLDGLRGIIHRLGNQDGISGVMILNPDKEVRFASDEAMLGRVMADESLDAHTRYTVNEHGKEVLRSVNPVNNKEICQQCHGPMAEHPVNGILFVDYDAAALRGKAMNSALTLGVSGALVLTLTLALLTLALQRLVVRPVLRLSEASALLSAGDLSVRVPVSGTDEVGRLGQSFNNMALTLEKSIAAIRQREEFQQSLIDGVPDGIRVIDSSFQVVAANKAFASQLRRPVGEIVGHPCHLSSHHRDTPCPMTLVTCPLQELRDNGAQSIKAVHQHFRADGEPFFVEVTAAPITITDADGNRQTLIVESVRDMSADVDLSHSQRLSEVAQLATGVAHEIRNPLVAIRMALEGILRKGGLVDGEQVQDPASLARYLRLIHGQMNSCIEVSERLLNLTHFPDEGPVRVDLAAAVDDAIALLKYEAGISNITVSVELAPAGGAMIMATGPELRMVLVNLIQNAFHAMPGGGTVTVQAKQDSGMVQLSVSDVGVGIPEDLMDRIFDPYFTRRADGVTGTGMGLPICKSIVESYGGRIVAESTVGVGTTFTLIFPSC